MTHSLLSLNRNKITYEKVPQQQQHLGIFSHLKNIFFGDMQNAKRPQSILISDFITSKVFISFR